MYENLIQNVHAVIRSDRMITLIPYQDKSYYLWEFDIMPAC